MLTYIQALPESDLSKLTSDMSPEVIYIIFMLIWCLLMITFMLIGLGYGSYYITDRCFNGEDGSRVSISEFIVFIMNLLVHIYICMISNTGPEVLVQQSYGSLAQLCTWQLIIGYKLREYEALDNGSFL